MDKMKIVSMKYAKAMWTYSRKCCETSSIHCIRYVSERGLHWSERLWWIVCLSVSITMCFAFIGNIWTQWKENPVKFSFTEAPIPISSVPFPTITICPEIKTSKQTFDVESVLAHPSKASEIEKQRLNDLAQICPLLADKIELVGNFVNDSIYKNLKIMGHLNITKRIFWEGEGVANDYQLLKCSPVVTDHGYCFTFLPLTSDNVYTDEMVRVPELMPVKNFADIANGTAIEYLAKNPPYKSLEDEIKRPWNNAIYPLHAVDVGSRSGLKITFRTEIPKGYFECSNTGFPFRLGLSEPGEVVKMSRNYHRVPLSSDMHVQIKGQITTTSEGLRKYDPNQRQCYFDDERQLRFFKIYTQSNCEEECLAELTNIKCGCVHFAMPRNKTTLICGAAKMTCYQKMAQQFHTKHVDFKESCNCLPACTSMEYNAHIERVKLDWNPFSNDSGAFYNRKFKESAMAVYFWFHNVKTMKRVESNTFTGILATFGGLLGLFMGISLLSVIELIFYATLHLHWTLRPIKMSNIIAATKRILNRFSFIRQIGLFFSELFKNSNIHGVSYFTRPGLHWTERLWWIGAVCLSVWLCSSSTNKIWQKWHDNPVGLRLTRNDMHISEIPFPTVTICPEIKSLAHKLDFADYMKPKLTLTDKEIIDCNTMSSASIWTIICSLSRDWPQNIASLSNTSMFANIKDIAPQMLDFIRSCRFQNVNIDCSKYIVPIYTDEGYCFTFNAMNSHEMYTDAMEPEMKTVKNNPRTTHWSLEKGYEKHTNDSEYPLRVFHSGRSASLEISFALNDREFIGHYRRMEKGSYVLLTVPGDAITLHRNYFRAPLLEDTRIEIKPKFINSSIALRKYDPSKRKCFFEDERELHFFKKYSERNCKEECLANLTYLQCGCVHYTSPRSEGQRICGAKATECFIECRYNFTSDDAFHAANNNTIDKCNCLPTCIAIEYNADVDRMLMDPVNSQKIGVVEENGHIVLHGKLTIFFSDKDVDVENRIEAFTLTDFLSTFGGLLGLFMGVSALSVVEIVYLCTLRWFCRKRHRSSGDDAPDGIALVSSSRQLTKEARTNNLVCTSTHGI